MVEAEFRNTYIYVLRMSGDMQLIRLNIALSPCTVFKLFDFSMYAG